MQFVLLGHRFEMDARGSANDAVRALLNLIASARPGTGTGSQAALAHDRETGGHRSPESARTERNLRSFAVSGAWPYPAFLQGFERGSRD